MKINYLAYLNPYLYVGGGELVMKRILDEATARGHDVKITSKEGTAQHREPDFWFLCDLYNCPREKFTGLYPLIDSIVKGTIPYCHHDNSYVDLCWFPALPCNGRGMDGFSCHVHGGHCSIGRAYALYANARLCSFMSPLHRDVHLRALGRKTLPAHKAILVPPLVFPASFCNRGMPRDIAYLSYGGQSEAKGYYNIMQRFPKGSMVFIGGSSPELLKPGDGHWLGTVPNEMMPEILNRTQNYVHLPRMPEPFSLIVAEAALCGCNLVVNENVGALSWQLDLADPATYENACGRYWSELETRMTL